MTREEALDSIRINIESGKRVKHMLAVETVMRSLARRLGENEDEWGITGLLHDIDIELVDGDMSTHGKLGADIVRELGASEAMAQAILSHNDRHGIPRKTNLAKALFCTDHLTGIIMATALVQPDKKLAGLEAKSVIKKFNQKGFAAGVDRQRVCQCSELGLELEEYVELGLKAMKAIAVELGM